MKILIKRCFYHNHVLPLHKLSFEDHYAIRHNLSRLIEDYSKKPLPKLSFEYLNYWNKNPHLQYNFSINITHNLLILVSKRINSFMHLNYNFIINQYIESIFKNYLHSLQLLLSINYPYDLNNIKILKKIITKLLSLHNEDNLFNLSKGINEIKQDYCSSPKSMANYPDMNTFLDQHLHDRILINLLCKHYLKIISSENNDNNYGIIDKDININQLITHTIDFVNNMTMLEFDKSVKFKIINKNLNQIKFNYIGSQFEYILTEILKNSARAHINNNTTDLLINILLLHNEYSNDLSIRISDRGGGIPKEKEPFIFNYSYTTECNNNNDIKISKGNVAGGNISRVAGLGFGLPLCRLYTNIFNGSLEMQNLPGFGVDTYLNIKGANLD